MTALFPTIGDAVSYWRREVRAACHAIRIYRLAVGRGMRQPSHQEYSALCKAVHNARKFYKANLRAAISTKRAA